MSSLTNLDLIQGILYLKTNYCPINRKLYDILFQINTYHRNELFFQEQKLLDSVLNNQILTKKVKGSLDVWNDIDNWKDIILYFEEEKRNEEHERVMMEFEDCSAKTVSELDKEIKQYEEELERIVEKHENFMMEFQDYPAKTVEELDREKRKFFELMYQTILFNLNLSIQDFLNFSYHVDNDFDEFEEKEFEIIKDNILINLIKINLNVFDFLDRFELSNFFLFRKIILLQIKIVSYEEETIVVGKTQRGKIEMILNKKKINQECLKQIMRKIKTFISNGKLEVQGPDGSSFF